MNKVNTIEDTCSILRVVINRRYSSRTWSVLKRFYYIYWEDGGAEIPAHRAQRECQVGNKKLSPAENICSVLHAVGRRWCYQVTAFPPHSSFPWWYWKRDMYLKSRPLTVYIRRTTHEIPIQKYVQYRGLRSLDISMHISCVATTFKPSIP